LPNWSRLARQVFREKASGAKTDRAHTPANSGPVRLIVVRPFMTIARTNTESH
jgi:hypothetical protein